MIDQWFTVTLTQDNKVFVNNDSVEFAQLKDKLAAVSQNRQDKGVFLRADEKIPYGSVMEVMTAIREAAGKWGQVLT